MDWDDETGEFAEHASKSADEQRGFNQIMDDHSLHEFIIRRGKTLVGPDRRCMPHLTPL
jgi:hypothetical protein